MSRERAVAALEAAGYRSEDLASQDHMMVLLEAFDIYLERQVDYQDLWKASGSGDNLMQARSKVSRMEVATTEKVKVDSGIDLINYAAFYVQNTRAGR